MIKLNKISSTAILVYIFLIFLVTLTESFDVKDDLYIYVGLRLFSALLVIPCYFLFKKNALNAVPQVLFALSLLIYNLSGYYFRPLYLPSFTQSIFALTFFVFMSRRLFLITVLSMTVAFFLFANYFKNSLPYDQGAYSAPDLILVLISSISIALLIHHFYTAQRHFAEFAHIQFGTAGRISARAMHDIKGSLQVPFLMSEDIKSAIDSKNYLAIEKISTDLNSQFQAVRNYLISFGQITSRNNIQKSEFNATDCINESKLILKNRLNSVLIEITGDCKLFGSKNLFTSVFINLISNSLEQFEKNDCKHKKICILMSTSEMTYEDSLISSPDVALSLSSDRLFATKDDNSSGMGIYFIKEALDHFDARLSIDHKNSQITFRILFNTKWL